MKKTCEIFDYIHNYFHGRKIVITKRKTLNLFFDDDNYMFGPNNTGGPITGRSIVALSYKQDY